MNSAQEAKKKILVVDDDVMIREILEEILIAESYAVLSVNNGERAVENIKNEKFDLVLLDLKLNGMDGIQTLEKIKSVENNIVVILVSGYLTVESIDKATRLGMFGYIKKPFDLDDLINKVKIALFTRSNLSNSGVTFKFVKT